MHVPPKPALIPQAKDNFLVTQTCYLEVSCKIKGAKIPFRIKLPLAIYPRVTARKTLY